MFQDLLASQRIAGSSVGHIKCLKPLDKFMRELGLFAMVRPLADYIIWGTLAVKASCCVRSDDRRQKRQVAEPAMRRSKLSRDDTDMSSVQKQFKYSDFQTFTESGILSQWLVFSIIFLFFWVKMHDFCLLQHRSYKIRGTRSNESQ